ncbi:hypothetical protein Tco_0844183, partial [Tanacetum coccineum]
MDIREEISLSKGDMLRKSSSLLDSDQNKHRNKLVGVKDKPQVDCGSPKKSKVIGSDSPMSKWVTRDMIVSTKHVVKVVNAQPISEFNPITRVQVVNKPIDVVVADNAKLGKNPVVADKDDLVKKPVVADKDDLVKKTVVADKDDVVKKSVVADKDDVVKKPVVADKASTTIVVFYKALATDNDKGSLFVDVVSDNIVLNKGSVGVKEKPVDVNENSAVNVGKAPVKDKLKHR